MLLYNFVFSVCFNVYVFPTTFMLRVSFSPVPECVVIGLLESSFSDPPRGTRDSVYYYYYYSVVPCS